MKKIIQFIKGKIFWLFIGGIALAAPFTFDVSPQEVTFSTVTMNEKVYNLTYTDDNTGEDLIIYGQQEFVGGWDKIEYVFSITNTVDTQGVDIQLFLDNKVQVVKISELIENIPYQKIKNVYGKKTINCKSRWIKATGDELISYNYSCGKIHGYCDTVEKESCIQNNAFLSTTTVTEYKDEWHSQTLKEATTRQEIKLIKPTISRKKEARFTVLKGETKYFKVVFNLPNERYRGEFVIEAHGTKGAKGQLN